MEAHKKVPKLLVSIALQFACVLVAQAQDIHFSQFYMAPLNQNPAFTGALYDIEAIVNYKNQWESLSFPYKTFAASFDMRIKQTKFKNGFLAAGINFYRDEAGDGNMGTTEADLNLAYHLHLNKLNTLGGGLQGGFDQRSVNFSALQWGNQFDGKNYNSSLPNLEPAYITPIIYPELGGGVLWTYDNSNSSSKVTQNDVLKWNIGASAFHIQEPGNSFYSIDNEKLDTRFVIHGDGLISIPNTDFGINPLFLYYKQGTISEIDIGAMVRYSLADYNSKYTGFGKGETAISAGLLVRTGDAFIVLMLLNYANYAIGFSYDSNYSLLTTATNGRGGLEVAIRYAGISAKK